MNYRPFNIADWRMGRATFATVATVRPSVANVADYLAGSEPQTVASVASVAGSISKRELLEFEPVRLLAETTPGDSIERAAPQACDIDVPLAYVAAFTAMQVEPPEGVPVKRWHQAIGDASRLLDRWGSTAVALGWPADDIFSWSPSGCCGLAWELQGREVIAMASDQAIIAESGSRIPIAFLSRPLHPNQQEQS